MRFGLGAGRLAQSALAISIAALFAAQPGRTGCWYGDSYDEIIAKNREALGAELVVNGEFTTDLAGWLDTGTGTKAWVAGNMRRTNPGGSGGAYQDVAVTPGQPYWVESTNRLVSGTAAGVGVWVYSGAGFTNAKVTSLQQGGSMFIPDHPVVRVYLYLDGVTVAEFERVSIRSVNLDKCVMFDDAFGTSPVFKVQSNLAPRGRGLLLDRSQGLAYGPNSFTDAAVAFAGGSSRVSPGVYRLYSPDGTYSYVGGTAFAATIGKWYQVAFTIDSVAVPGSGVSIEGVDNQPTIPTTVGRKTMLVRANIANMAIKRAGTAVDAQISNITVRELPGHHMVQPTLTARGEFSRRYNTLLNSALVGGAASPTNWSRPTGTGASAPVSTAADGSVVYRQSGIAADRPYLQSDVVNNVSVGEVWRARVEVQALTGSVPMYQVAARAGTASATVVYMLNGVVVADVDLAQPNSVVEVIFTFTVAGTSIFRFGPGSSGGMAGAFSLDFTRPDVRPNADFIPTLPNFQRVLTASDYDEVGFPTHWRGKTDDGGTASLVLSAGTTKAIAVLGLQKMSDATQGSVLEFANATISGWFLVHASPNANLGRYGVSLRGLSTGSAGFLGTMPYAAYPAPTRNYLMVELDVAAVTKATQIKLKVNGLVPATSDDGTSVAATGTFASGTMKFGNGNGFYGDIREYAPPFVMFMLPADPGPSTSQIAALNKKFSKAVGVSA